MNDKPRFLFVRNLAQKVLWDMELSGQLSDGHWENASPRDHFRPWCWVNVVVNEKRLGRDFSDVKRDRYAFASPTLLECVGKRMLAYVRVAKVFGQRFAETIENLFDLEGDLQVEVPADLVGEYWDAKRTLLKALNLPEIVRVVNDESVYSRKELVRDLRDLSRIVRTRSGEPVAA